MHPFCCCHHPTPATQSLVSQSIVSSLFSENEGEINITFTCIRINDMYLFRTSWRRNHLLPGFEAQASGNGLVGKRCAETKNLYLRRTITRWVVFENGNIHHDTDKHIYMSTLSNALLHKNQYVSVHACVRPHDDWTDLKCLKIWGISYVTFNKFTD